MAATKGLHPSNTKTCSVCHLRKPISQFYRKHDSKDGHRNMCKDCYGVVQARYRRTVNYWWTRYRWFVNTASTMDEKRRKGRCREIAVRAIKLGIITRPELCPCCGKRCQVDAHHHDYSLPLRIEWLCRYCHIRADRTREAKLGIVRRSHPYHPIPHSVKRKACRLWATGKYSQVAIGRMLGMHNSTVSKTVRGQI